MYCMHIRNNFGLLLTFTIDCLGGLQREDLADLELAKKKQNVLLKQLLAMPGREQVLNNLGVERRSSEVGSAIGFISLMLIT